jgi:nicotinamidase/pyrazinamidase
MKALIIVDIQNDFLPGGALAVTDGDKTISLANLLMPYFDLVVATQDFHPADHGSFALHAADIGKFINLNGLTQILWPVHCVQGSKGVDFPLELDTQHIDKIVPKGMDKSVDSYSGFFDNGRKKATGLDEYLKEQNVDELYVIGLATDYCVKFTALDALGLGYKTYLIEDACRGVNIKSDDVENALVEMKQAGIKVITHEVILRGEKC